MIGVQPPRRGCIGRRQPDLARHGRHDRQGGDHRGRRTGAHERVRGRRRHQPRRASSSRAAAMRSSCRSSTSPRSARAAAASSRSTSSAVVTRRAAQRRRRSGAGCYGLGGAAPTLTDALLALGYLNAGRLGGGAITLDPRRSREALDQRRRDAARPVGRGGLLRHPHARRRDDDARGQGGHHLSRPRPTRLHALRVRRQRPADGRRDRPLARDVHRADSSRSRRLQRPRASLLRHRARGGTHVDAARR